MSGLVRRLGAAHIVSGAPRPLGVPAEAETPIVVADPASIEKGFEEGLAAGREAAAAELVDLRDRLCDESAQQLRQATEALDAQREAYRTACAGLAREVSDDRLWAEGLAVEIAHAALARWSGDHARDAAWVEACCSELMRELPRMRYTVRVAAQDVELVEEAMHGVDVVAAPALSAGQIVIETPRGDFEAGIAQRMDAVRDALLAGLVRGKVR